MVNTLLLRRKAVNPPLPLSLRKIKMLLAIVTGIILFNASEAWANAISSNGTGGGAWSDGTIWVGGFAPGPGDDVTIVDGDVVTVDVSVSCNSLIIQSDGGGANGFAVLTVGGGVTFTVVGNIDLTSINGGGASTIQTSTGSTSILNAQSDINFNVDDGNEVPTLIVDFSSSLNISGNFNLNSVNSVTTFKTSSIVNYNGAGTQTVIATTYGKLQSSGSGARTLDPSGTILIKNNSATCFTPGTNAYTIAGSTINFGGTGVQTIPAFNYNNLTISAARTTNSITLVNGGTIGIAGILSLTATFTSGVYVMTNNTIDFNGSGAQTIPAFNYNNLTTSTDRTSNNITLINGGTIGIAGTFNPTATFTAGGVYVIANNTIDYNGSGAQTIAAFNYNNLSSSSTGGRTLDGTGTIGIAGTFTPFTNAYTITGSTIDFNGSGAQTIPAFNYNNLTSSDVGGRTLASSGIIGIADVFTPGTNAYTVTGSTVNFNGTVNQTIPMPAAMALYNDITINCTGVTGATLGGAVDAINVAGNITVQTNILNNGGFAMAGNGGATFQVNDGTFFFLTGTSAMPSGFGTVTLQPLSTVDFDGAAGDQTIDAFNYGNLTSSNTGTRTLVSSGSIGVATTFTPGTNAYTITGSTMDFNGTGAQTIPAFNYNNLTTSTDRTSNNITLVNGGTIGIAGTFNPTATFSAGGAYIITNNTIDYNGSGAQSVGAFNYNNLTISGSHSADITLAAAGTIGVFGAFSPTATFTGGAYVITGSTIDYNGTGAQTVAAFNYNNLTLSGARTTNNVTLAPAGSIGVFDVFNPTSTFSSGKYVITGSTIDFNGSGAQTVIAFKYDNLTSSNTGGRTLSPTDTVHVAEVFTPGANVYTVTGSTVDFNGTVNQTIPMPMGTALYNDIAINCTGVTGATLGGAVDAINVAGNITVQVGTLNNGGFAMAGNGTKTFQVNDGAFFFLTGTSAMPSGFGFVTLQPLSTVDFDGAAGDQTIDAFNYGNLTSSNGGTRTLVNSGSIGVATTFTPGTNVYTITGSTMDFNGAGSQTIPAFNYNNLAISNPRTSSSITLVNGGVIGVAGTFNPTATFTLGGAYIITNNTIDYNGGGAQSVAAFNYNNLTISGSHSADITLAPAGTIGVFDTFNPSATFTSGAYVITGSTIDYNGTGAQSIVAFNYDNLTLSGVRTTNDVTLAPAGTIGVFDVFNPASTFSSGKYVITGSTIDFNGNGGGGQTIPAFRYDNLTSSNTGGRTLSPTDTVHVAEVFTPGTNAYTVAGSTVNFNGTVNQNIPMPAAMALYNNVAVNCTGVNGATLAGAVDATNVVGNITVQTGILNNGGFAMAGSGGQTFQVNDGTFFFLTGTSAMPSGFGTVTLQSLSTVDFDGAAGDQTIDAFNYGNLTSSNTGTRTLVSSGSIGVATVFTPGTNAYTITGSTIDYNGTGAQSVVAFDYNNLTISGARSGANNVTLANSGNIGVFSTFNPTATFGTGTYIIDLSTINFNGTAPQTVPAFTFYNVSQNNSAGASLGGNVNLTNILTINSGTFTNPGSNFTLLSTAARTASIAPITGAGADFSGNIIMQRYAPVSANTNDWRFFGSAIDATATIADWTDNFATSGFTGATCGPTDCATPGCEATCNYPSIYWYDESVIGVMDSGYVAATNVTNTLVNGRGYWVYLGPTPVTFDLPGPPNKFSKPLPVSYTNTGSPADDGWNLVSNPYPSAINWDTITDGTHWTKDHMSAAIYVYNSSTGAYSDWVTGVGTTNQGSNYIASQQSFWVQADGSGAPVLTARESVKASAQPVFLKTENSVNTSYYPRAFTDFPVPLNANTIPGVLKLTASGNGRADEIIIAFKQGATSNFDGKYDAWKLVNPDTLLPNFSSVIAGNKDLSINTQPALTSNVDIPLRLTVPKHCTGVFKISRDSVLMLPLSSCLVLEDKKTGTMVDLRSVVSYTFTIADTTRAPRFILHIASPVTKKTLSSTCPNTPNGTAIGKGTGAGPWTYVWKNSAGTIVQTTNMYAGADTLKHCLAGTYSVSISGGACGAAMDTLVVKSISAIASAVTQTGVSCYGGHNATASVSASGGIPAYSYLWSNGQTSPQASGLSFGNYSVVTTDGIGCTKTATVSIAQPAALIADFTASTYTLDISVGKNVTFLNGSSGASSYQWNFGDGSAHVNSVNPVHAYTATGTYTVALVSTHLACSDTVHKTIKVINSSTVGLNENTFSSSSSSVSVVYDQGEVFLQFSLETETRVNIEVYNMVGQKILSRDNLEVKNEKVKLDFPYSAVGIYIAVSEMKNAVVSKKIIIPMR